MIQKSVPESGDLNASSRMAYSRDPGDFLSQPATSVTFTSKIDDRRLQVLEIIDESELGFSPHGPQGLNDDKDAIQSGMPNPKKSKPVTEREMRVRATHILSVVRPYCI